MRTIPEIIEGHNEGKEIIPKQMKLLRRLDKIDNSWQVFLDNQPDNFGPEHEFRNLFWNQNVTDPELLMKQIKEIAGPTLEDVD